MNLWNKYNNLDLSSVFLHCMPPEAVIANFPNDKFCLQNKNLWATTGPGSPIFDLMVKNADLMLH